MENIEELKLTSSLKDELIKYGIEVNSNGFCKCPFHGEKTASFKVYGNRYYCFGCHEHGDVITFIMKIEGIGFGEACRRLAKGISYSEYRKARKKRSNEDAERSARERAWNEYIAVFDEWIFNEKCLSLFEPPDAGASASPLFFYFLNRRSDSEKEFTCSELKLYSGVIKNEI